MNLDMKGRGVNSGATVRPTYWMICPSGLRFAIAPEHMAAKNAQAVLMTNAGPESSAWRTPAAVPRSCPRTLNMLISSCKGGPRTLSTACPVLEPAMHSADQVASAAEAQDCANGWSTEAAVEKAWTRGANSVAEVATRGAHTASAKGASSSPARPAVARSARMAAVNSGERPKSHVSRIDSRSCVCSSSHSNRAAAGKWTRARAEETNCLT